jgi:hypothetical protein
MDKVIGGILVFVVAMVVWAVIGLVFAVPVMLLWNFAVVPLGAPVVGYLQAWGIFLLSCMIFKGSS